jgi:hypothetical protein
MQAANPAKFIGCPRGYPAQTAMAPSESGMPDTRPAGYDPGAQMFPDIPLTWRLTEAAYKDAVAQLEALAPIASLFPDQIASLRQLLARHDARVKYESDEAEHQVPRIRAAARVTEAIRLAQTRGIDWQGALDDFLQAVEGAARQVATVAEWQ